MRFEPTRIHQLVENDFDTIIDVRSPAEFAEDHVPGAINLPVLDDDERAHIGTIYVQQSPFLARKLGAALVARNAAAHIEGALADKDGGWQSLVYCWRGGQRSGSFASILSQIGWRVSLLDGGYQTWRRLVKTAVYDEAQVHKLVLLDGNTGTAKTDLLARLAKRGVQTIDLEGLAGHRGSALGSRGQQPAQKSFESALATRLASLDPKKPVVVEAESSKIGRINLPPSFFAAMKKAPRLEVSASTAERAKFLVEAYEDVLADRVDLKDRLDKLRRIQGHDRVDHWHELVDRGAFHDLAHALIEQHYDPRYAKARERVGGRIDKVFTATSLDVRGRESLADAISRDLTAR